MSSLGAFRRHKILALVATVLLVLASTEGLAKASTSAETVAAAAKSFPDWKSEKVKNATFQVMSAKLALKKKLTQPHPDPAVINELSLSLSQFEWDAEAARDLTVKDYAALYLSQIQNTNRLREIAVKLTAEDNLRLLEAYLQILKEHQEETPAKLEPHLPRHSSGVDDGP